MRYCEIRSEMDRRFEKAGISDHATDARYILQSICGMSYAELLLRQGEDIPEDRLQMVIEAAARREAHEPLQYILGSQEFMGLEIECSPACLIPRLDTELLASMAVDHLRRNTADQRRVIDMCTGTGCIAIAMAVEVPDAEVVASDISEEALCVAERNNLKYSAGVRFVQSDLFDKIDGRFDLIVSNPPYISATVMEGLTPEVVAHEPMLALSGGSDGMDFYRRIAVDAVDYISAGGRIMMEIGEEQGAAITAMLEQAGWQDIRIYKDLAGLDRVIEGKWR